MHGVTVVADKNDSMSSEGCSTVLRVALPQEVRHG
jgi:hypothetical protein